MNLLDEQVTHDSFGEGIVVWYDESYIEVRFPLGIKKFIFPDVFGTHLFLTDAQIAARVEQMKRDVEKERFQLALELERQKAVEEAERLLKEKREALIKSHKLSPVSQVVFWCQENEQDQVFEERRIFTGLRKSGARAGMPNRLVRVHQNSCCLLTSRTADEQERERRIVGFFMVAESFVGRLSTNGYIPAHHKYRLRLSEDESRELLFWNYYLNKRYPDRMTWNSGRYRYFDNVWMAQILQKAAALKRKTAEQELAQAMLKYFCEMNRLTGTELPQPTGALLKK